MKNLLYLIGIMLFTTTTTNAQDCNLNEDAKRYFVRADVVIKAAKNVADYLNAAEEFKKALQYAPDCPDIYYNIAMCYDKSATSGFLIDKERYSEAVKYYKKFIELKTDAPNKKAIQNRIYELEYKIEKLNEKFLVAKGRSVIVNGKKLNQKEVKSIMGNTDAFKSYNKGLSNNGKGNFCLFTGFCLIAVAGTYFALTDRNNMNISDRKEKDIISYLCIGTGALLSINGISLKSGSIKHIRNAVDIYNNRIGKTASIDLKVGFTGTGLGLALNF